MDNLIFKLSYLATLLQLQSLYVFQNYRRTIVQFGKKKDREKNKINEKMEQSKMKKRVKINKEVRRR